MGRILRYLGVVVALLAGIVSLSGCTYYVGQMDQLVPLPDNVAVKQPPQITSCSATFQITSHHPVYRTACAWGWWPTPYFGCGGCGYWRWRCWSVWDHTDFCGDLIVRLEVMDPSDDLDATHSPRVRVLGAEPASSGGPTTSCLLPVTSTEVPIGPGDIVGSGLNKSVTVRLTNVCGQFTPDCQELAAVIPLRVLFDDCGTNMASVNACRATVVVKSP